MSILSPPPAAARPQPVPVLRAGSSGVKRISPLLILLASACSADQADDLSSHRSAVECPPGCICECIDPTTGTGTDTDPVSGTASSSGSDASSTTGAATTWPQTEGLHTVNGRRYRIRLPQGWDGVTPVRPIFAFHPHGSVPSSQGGAAKQEWDSYHLTQNGAFMVVLPESGTHTCGANDCYRWLTEPSSSDSLWVQEVIAEVESWSIVDATHRYLTGWSGGAFMAQSVACNFGADRIIVGSGGIRNIVGNGTQLGGLPSTCLPTDVFVHHGSADTTVPLSLGIEARDAWAAANGCTGSVVATGAAGIDWCASVSGQSPCCEEYSCTDGELVWCVDDLAHNQASTGWVQRDIGEVLFNG